MSDTVAIALIAAGFPSVVTLATLIFQWLRENRASEESYRLKLYAKRLQVHQQAFQWLMKAVEPLKRCQRDNVQQKDRDELIAICKEAEQWWNANCLYLDPVSKEKLNTFLAETQEWAANPTDPQYIEYPELRPLRLYRDAWWAIQKGIGVKHIDMKALPEEFRQ